MKQVKVQAFNGIGTNKVLAGERMVDQPETLAEAMEIEKREGSDNPEQEVLAGYWSSKVIDIQRQIRAGTTMSAKQQLNAIMAFAQANPNSDVAKTLAALKIGVESGKPEEKAAAQPTPKAPTKATK